MWGRGTVLGGRYALGERIGGGAMGEVWRAGDAVLERSVAVKILLPKLLEDPQFAARFRREAKLLASLGHPGIVDIHDYGEQDGAGPDDDRLAYIVMELVDGRPLDEVREDEGPMPAARALDLVAQALDALHTAHRGGIVHRDLKPSNLMLRADGRITVTDFGIAHSKAASRLTASHSVLGTALYIAPEQAEGLAIVPASDLYSLGVVTYELLTGEPPFNGDTVLEIVLKHLREPAPALPDSFPAPVRDFVARALAKAPEERHADAATMAAAARAAVGSAGEGAPGPAPVAARPPMPPAPVAIPVPVPVVPEVTSAPPVLVSGPTTSVPVPQPWWKRLPKPVVVAVPVVLSTATVLTFVLMPNVREADLAKPGPKSSVPAGQKPGAALPPAPHGTPGATATGRPAKDGGAKDKGKGKGDSATTGGNDSKDKPGTGTSSGPGGKDTDSGKGDGGTGSGSGSGSGSGGGAKPPPGPGKPGNCGGDSWGAITNVGSGRKMGLAGTDPASTGGKVVSGGNTQFGWVSGGNQFPEFHACTLAGSALGLKQAPAYDEKTGVVLAPSTGYSGYVTGWKTTPAAGGAVQINYYVGDGCVTDVGAGRQLAVDPCTPGNKHQLWRLPG
ncbi:serine/threonine protein kinase [Streptomyces sp. NBC_00237]|uniref:serine/threonine-protein kinase n=1 Tax=Streptomyces sp. NBC_00237 TaxID=2975687 RepID=UPI00225847FE|nr:serine/threonine-protein kinase [Streptomyces sp. NBC_00237]MCX5200171.1 serine/threonine protein kinase [Streptomyces sp. NBC_00237]